MSDVLVTKSSMPDINDYIEEIRSIWDTHWLTNMGPKHQTLQKMLIEYLNVKKLDLLTNGHMALELALQAYDLKGEVITTPFTFVSTTHAIVRNGLRPVFCDINADDYTIDTNKLEKMINKNTSAIVPVHVYGNICKVDEIERIARKYGLKVIYDAAHAFGVTYKGKGVGNFGDVSCFSFHATKVFNTIEGGAVCFSDEKIGSKIYDLKNFGIHGPESVEGIGANAKMSEFCAAMGICNLRMIDGEILKRKKIVDRYRCNLSGIKGIQLNVVQDEVKSNYSYFPIVVHKSEFGVDRDTVFKELERKGFGARKYFYPLTNMMKCYEGVYDATSTPIALEISKSVLTLPLYADLEIEHVDSICEIIRNCAR